MRSGRVGLVVALRLVGGGGRQTQADRNTGDLETWQYQGWWMAGPGTRVRFGAVQQG